MNGLRTTRVLIIDDDPDEVMPVIQALGRFGIGCLLISDVNVENLPENPYQGIRIIFLDMKLDVEGTPRQIVGKTIGVLKRIVSVETLP